MFGTMSLIGVVAGGALAHYAQRFPACTELLETSAGVLLIGGLMLLGSGLQATL